MGIKEEEMKTKQEYLEIMSNDLDVSFLEDAPEKFVRQFYIDYDLCKRLNFVPIVKGDYVLLKHMLGFSVVNLKKALEAAKREERFKTFLNSLKKGDTVRVHFLTTFEKDYTVKRVNRNSKGEVSSVTVDKNWKITIDDIAFEGSYGSEIISESRFWYVEIYNTAHSDYELGLLLDKFPEIKEEFLNKNFDKTLNFD